MSAPNPFPCGGRGQPACPPQPAITIEDTAYFTLAQMQAHGAASYHKGLVDAHLSHPADEGPKA